MARQYEGHSRLGQMSETEKVVTRKGRKKKKQKVLTLGVISMSLFLGIIFFVICFIVGMGLSGDLPI